MENLVQILDDKVTPKESERTATGLSSLHQKIKRLLTTAFTHLIGQNNLLQWRGQQFSVQFMKAEKESKLPIQEKIILLAKAITICYETFDFTPNTLEMMLVKKVEEMNRSLRKQLAQF